MNARSRVLLIGPLPNPRDVIGGTKVSFANLVDELRESGRFVIVVHDTSRARQGRSKLRRHWDDLASLCSVISRLLSPRKKYDLVLFNTSSGAAMQSGFLVWAACRLRRSPLVVRVFGGDFDLFLDRAAAPLRALAERTLLRSDLLLLQTNELCTHFARAHRVEWWPTTRNLEPAAASARAKAQRFLFLGQLRPEKGAADAAAAASQLPPGAQLTICGPAMPGMDGGQFDGRAGVQYKSPVASSEVRDLLAAHDVLVFPSYHEGEGMPGVVIEALQMGLPVIATRWRALPEIVIDGQNGLLTLPRDSNSLAAAMLRLVNEPELFQQLRQGALESGARFRSPLWTSQLVEWMEQLCGAAVLTSALHDWHQQEAA